MPIDGALTPQEIGAIKAWIDQGAHWDEAIPPLRSTRRGRQVLAALENMPDPARGAQLLGLQASRSRRRFRARPHASSIRSIASWSRRARKRGSRRRRARLAATLLRRAYLDLIGLPPTPAETAAFLADTAPDAWERLIDKLLASPHYGERWGRHWLDVARYADSSGFEHDVDRPNAWRYRDYVIRAFNQDKPYDVFLESRSPATSSTTKTDETLIATGFLRAGPRVAFREKDNPECRYEYLDDMIATTGRGVLGLTVQCARCHNHKFDPIPQKDYYSLKPASSATSRRRIRWCPPRKRRRTSKKVREIEARQAPLKAEIRKIEAPYEDKVRQAAYKKYPGERAARGREAGRASGRRENSCSRSRSSNRSASPGGRSIRS